jgi:hypothetical protein
MKQEFAKYLESLGQTSPIVERAALLESFYSNLFHEEIADIFLSESINSEGQRVPENLWFFSNTWLMEAHNFATAINFDFTPRANIDYVIFEAQDYDFKAAHAKSRLTVQLRLGQIIGIIKASMQNCDVLRDLAAKYLLTR